MLHVPLKVPLCFFTAVGCGKRSDAANPRIQALGNPFDRAALSSCIAPFKNHYKFVTSRHNPFLQLDQFALQGKQVSEIISSRLMLLWRQIDRQVERQIFKRQLQLFIKTI
jgi:hypothetical protein